MTLSIKNIQERYGVGEHTVLGWIHSGELKAVNVARKPGGRPKFRITEAALTAFEELRASQAPAPRAKRRRNTNNDVMEFIK